MESKPTMMATKHVGPSRIFFKSEMASYPRPAEAHCPRSRQQHQGACRCSFTLGAGIRVQVQGLCPWTASAMRGSVRRWACSRSCWSRASQSSQWRARSSCITSSCRFRSLACRLLLFNASKAAIPADFPPGTYIREPTLLHYSVTAPRCHVGVVPPSGKGIHHAPVDIGRLTFMHDFGITHATTACCQTSPSPWASGASLPTGASSRSRRRAFRGSM